MINFTMNEEIILNNDDTEKVYTLVMNQSGRNFDVTREWTIPTQSALASKTDRFTTFPAAARHLKSLYEQRVSHGYKETLRRTGVVKKSDKVETHKPITKVTTVIPDKPITVDPPGRNIEKMVKKRQRTGIIDRIKW